MGEDAISEEDHLRWIGKVSIGDEERLMGVPWLEADGTELDVPRREEGENMLDCCLSPVQYNSKYTMWVNADSDKGYSYWTTRSPGGHVGDAVELLW